MIPPPLDWTLEDFEAVEAAVMATERGRWFLMEYARRLRNEESREIVDAIARLEQHAVRAEDARAQSQSRFEILLGGLGDLLAGFRPPAPVPKPPLEGRLRALAQLDGLSVEDKLRLFG